MIHLERKVSMEKKIISTQFLENKARDEVIKLETTQEKYTIGHNKEFIIYSYNTTTYKRK
jgi:hypothetical protein